MPMFTGCKRDFHRWKRDWESLQKQGEPSGSEEVKKIQLLDSIDEKIVKDLRLPTYNTATDIFRVMTNRFGNKCTIALEIVEELEKIPPVRGNLSLRREKQLRKEPEWLTAYTAQVHEMVERGAAKRLMIEDWKGPVWYVSHLVAPNPHSVTTPVRLVWNSSQKFHGVSMNDLLLKGPDVLNPVRAVLIRFRRGVHAVLGDIQKMYNSVWLEDREMHLHRFLWRDRQEDKIEEYAITRVNIGDRPAGCIAQLAMRETARLTKFSHLKEARRVLEEDSYMDDILVSHNDMNRLVDITKEIEGILEAGGFSLKPWVWSGQSGRQEGREQTKKAVGSRR
ncbi:hypothetical protein NFI96_001271 [Prochilodus magdalenae]|nr:hypothetical protein NFI96_001271 [Prochilodus magdalenae]